MRLIGWRPFGYGPKSVHHAAGAVGKFVGPPPLVAVGRVSSSRKSLKVRDPVVGAEGSFLVSGVAGLRVVKGFDGGQTGAVAVAALIGLIAAKILSVALFGGDGCAVHDVLWPL